MSKRNPTTRQLPVVQMSETELSAAITEWDAARAKLDHAGIAAASAQAVIDRLPANAAPEARMAADEALAAAKISVAEAEAAAMALKPPPAEAAAAFLAKRQEQPEIPAGSHVSELGQSGAAAPAQALPGAGLDGGNTAGTSETAPEPDAVASASGTHTTPSETADGGAGNAAGPAPQAGDFALDEAASSRWRIIPPTAEILGEYQDMLARLVGNARSDAAIGDVAGAIYALRDWHSGIVQHRAAVDFVLSGLSAEIATLEALIVTAPVEFAVRVIAKVDSRWRIGRQFTKDHTDFEAGELAADELELLRADPLLTITEV